MCCCLLRFSNPLQRVMAGGDRELEARWRTFFCHQNPFLPALSRPGTSHPDYHLFDGLQSLGMLGNKLHHWSAPTYENLQRYAQTHRLVEPVGSSGGVEDYSAVAAER